MMAAAAALLVNPALGANGKLLIFMHVAVKQHALQSLMQRALPGIDVVAVGRIADFERSLRAGVDAVLALRQVLAAYKLSPSLQGQCGGSSEERYSLVGAGLAPDPARVKTLGALNLLGRDGTNSFVQALLGTSPKVALVSKVEDLLPLLQLQRADAVLLPSRLFPEVQRGSKLALASNELAKTVALPAAASATPLGVQVLSALSRIPANLCKILGVELWR
jgi:hypothetical protein